MDGGRISVARQPARPAVSLQIRLPTEAEWEKAARGGLALPAGAGGTVPNPNPGRRYPWGASPVADHLTPEEANYAATHLGATSAVGCFPAGASPYGVLDLLGNVWEWCQTRWVDNYRDYGTIPALDDPEGTSPRAGRGSAFLNEARSARCAYRYRLVLDYLRRNQGFRLVGVGASPVLLWSLAALDSGGSPEGGRLAPQTGWFL